MKKNKYPQRPHPSSSSNIKPTRQPSQRFQPRIIIYDSEQSLQQPKCKICKKAAHQNDFDNQIINLDNNNSNNGLISVCQCDFKYHQKCLLKFIKLQILKVFKTFSPFDKSDIKCPSCQKQITFTYEQSSHIRCDYFSHTIHNNCCNRYFIILIILTIILIVIVLVALVLYVGTKSQTIWAVFYLIVGIGVIVCGLLLYFIGKCSDKYLEVREIKLKTIVPFDSMANGGGANLASNGDILSSDEDSPQLQQNNIEHVEILID